MKKLLTMLLVSVAMISCDKNDDGEPTAITVPNQTELEQTVYADQTTGKSGVTFTTAGAWTSTISETSPTRSDKTSSPEWISIDPASGDKAGSYTISISLSKNLTGAKRSATITIVCGGERITISITQEATTEEGKEPEPEPEVPETPEGQVKKINGEVIEYIGNDNGFYFSKIGDVTYGNKIDNNNSKDIWAYVTGKAPKFDAWYCYFYYGTNGLVKYTEYHYNNINVNHKTSYAWDEDKLIAVYNKEYDEIQSEGMRLDIKYGDTEYSKGNIDINWLLANSIDGNQTFKTPYESAIDIRSVPYSKLISSIVLTDLYDGKLSGTYAYRYEFNSEGYITKIHETLKLESESSAQPEYAKFTFDY